MIVGLLMTMVGLTMSAPVHALSLAPSIVDEHANPGETKTFTITLQNDESEPMRVYPSIQKFVPLGTSGQQQFLPPSDISGIPSWTFLSAMDRVLQPGEKESILVQVRVPQTAPLGGMYEALFFSSQPPLGATNTQIGIRSRIGALVLFSVGDSSESRLTVSDWRLLDPLFRTSLRNVVRVGIKNIGVSHVVPHGDLIVRNLFGSVVTRIPLNSTGARVLPASERTFDVSLGPPEQTQGMLSSLLNELTALGLGRYTISLEGATGVALVPSALSLTIFPWHVVGAIVIVGLLLVIGFRWYRVRLIRAMQGRSV